MQVAIQRRPTLLVLVVLALLFILMSFSTRTRAGGETRNLAERTVITFFSPIPKVVNRIGLTGSDMYHGYLDMRGAVRENAKLHRRVAELTNENLELRQSHGELARLRTLLAYSERFTTRTSLAEVIMLDMSGRFKSIIIDRGSKDGVEVNDVAVSPAGLVGRVILTTNDMAKVQMIIDPSSAVGCMIDRTRRQGVVRGDGRGGLEMIYVPALADVANGDVILTAGIDGIYPKGLPVATVTNVEEGKDLFKRIKCTPMADFGSLEELIILHTKKIPEEVVRY